MSTSLPTQTWVPQPDLGGLFLLHLDGVPAAATSLVNHGASRAEQLDQLLAQDWVPPLQQSAAYDAIVAGQPYTAYIGSVPAGRRAMPFIEDQAAVIDLADDQPPPHPVRDYLFARLGPDGRPLLEVGERPLIRLQQRKPEVTNIAPDGQRWTLYGPQLSRLVSMSVTLTDRRLILHGKDQPPFTKDRRDYSIGLGLISPGLADIRAARKQNQRRRETPVLHWALHLRHEWISGLSQGVRTPPLRYTLMSKQGIQDPSRFLLLARYAEPWGTTVQLTIGCGQSFDQMSDIVEQYWQAIRAITPTAVRQPPEKRQFLLGQKGSPRSREERTDWAINGTMPHSLPASFTTTPGSA